MQSLSSLEIKRVYAEYGAYLGGLKKAYNGGMMSPARYSIEFICD